VNAGPLGTINAQNYPGKPQGLTAFAQVVAARESRVTQRRSGLWKIVENRGSLPTKNFATCYRSYPAASDDRGGGTSPDFTAATASAVREGASRLRIAE
jgi:hypothetical protein